MWRKSLASAFIVFLLILIIYFFIAPESSSLPNGSVTQAYSPPSVNATEIPFPPTATPKSIPTKSEPIDPLVEETVDEVAITQLPAFPGAQGHGALSIGGRGGQIIPVTNLNDSGPGSLRAAVEAEGPRTVVFQVAGIIVITDSLDIKSPFLTIAGQTAPGGGITIRGGIDHLFRLRKGVHDVIIRYLRLRHGAGAAGDNDNFNVRGGNDIIVDHLSLSWSTDENLSLYRDEDDEPIYNVTVQRTIMAEGLSVQSNGIQISGVQDYSDPNNPVEAWRQISDVSLHHNLFIHNTHRNPRVISSGTEVINNVVYNWKHRIGSTRSATRIDYLNNYFKDGPMSNFDELIWYEDCSDSHPDWVCPLPEPSIYIDGNITLPLFPDPTVDNWQVLKHFKTLAPLPLPFRRQTRLTQPEVPVIVHSAVDAFASILNDVGANARLDCLGNWVSNLDTVDVRLIADATNGTGHTNPIDTPDDVGGYPVVNSGTACIDSDGDGMPDEFELLYDFNPSDPADGPQDLNGDGYTNVEEYLNGRDPRENNTFLPNIQHE